MNTEIQKYLKIKLSSTIHNVLKEWGTEWGCITELDKLNDFKGEIIGRLFEKYLNYCKSYNQTTNPCSAKEVIAAIKVKKTIKAKRDNRMNRLSFPNYTYEIEDTEHKFRIKPLYGKFSYHDYPPQWVSISTDAFVDAILEFDALIPYINERIENSIAPIMPQIQQQCEIAKEVEKLIERYLKKENICCTLKGFHFEGRPRLYFSKGGLLPLNKNINPLEMEDFFRKVPELMKKRPYVNNYLHGRYSGTITVYMDYHSLSKKDRWELIDYFIKNDSHTHSQISSLAPEKAHDGILRLHFDFIEFDWVHMFWDIENKFPELKAWYMVVPSEKPYSFYQDVIYTNDTEGKYFLVEDRTIKVVECVKDIRKDCDIDRTDAIKRKLRNDIFSEIEIWPDNN